MNGTSISTPVSFKKSYAGFNKIVDSVVINPNHTIIPYSCKHNGKNNDSSIKTEPEYSIIITNSKSLDGTAKIFNNRLPVITKGKNKLWQFNVKINPRKRNICNFKTTTHTFQDRILMCNDNYKLSV